MLNSIVSESLATGIIGPISNHLPSIPSVSPEIRANRVRLALCNSSCIAFLWLRHNSIFLFSFLPSSKVKCHDGLPSVKWNRFVCVALYMHLDGMNDFSRERVIENVVITLSDDMSLFHWHNPQQGCFSMSYEIGLNKNTKRLQRPLMMSAG